MALSKTILGTELKNGMAQFNNVVIDTSDPAAMDTYRTQYWDKMADIIVTHIQTYAVPQVPGTGLTTPNGAVTGTSQTGKIL